MVACDQCDKPMIREDLYNAEENTIVKVAVKQENYWWICINKSCPIGQANTRAEFVTA